MPQINFTLTFRGGRGNATVSVFSRANHSLVFSQHVKRSGTYPMDLKLGKYALSIDGIAPQEGSAEFVLDTYSDPETPDLFEFGAFSKLYTVDL